MRVLIFLLFDVIDILAGQSESVVGGEGRRSGGRLWRAEATYESTGGMCKWNDGGQMLYWTVNYYLCQKYCHFEVPHADMNLSVELITDV